MCDQLKVPNTSLETNMMQDIVVMQLYAHKIQDIGEKRPCMRFCLIYIIL